MLRKTVTPAERSCLFFSLEMFKENSLKIPSHLDSYFYWTGSGVVYKMPATAGGLFHPNRSDNPGCWPRSMFDSTRKQFSQHRFYQHRRPTGLHGLEPDNMISIFRLHFQIWDLASGTLKLSLTGHVSSVRGLAVSARQPYLFSCGEDKMVRCWDLEQNKVIWKSAYQLLIHLCLSEYALMPAYYNDIFCLPTRTLIWLFFTKYFLLKL